MSEYQYYYFESIDKPLTPQQQNELRMISSRAKITSRTFENEYHFGSFGGRPLEMMKKYFDVHIYYACWATRVLMFKVPAQCIDLKQARRYCTPNTFEIVEHDTDLILSFDIWIDGGEGYWQGTDVLIQLISLRDDIIAGDYRCLYLAWLAQRHDDNRREDDDPVPPPVPAGLRNLTEPLRKFAEFMFLEKNDLEEAAELSGDDLPKPPSSREFKEWIATLPKKMKDQTILSLLEGKETPQAVRGTLMNRFLLDRKKATKPVKKTCQKKPPKKP